MVGPSAATVLSVPFVSVRPSIAFSPEAAFRAPGIRFDAPGAMPIHSGIDQKGVRSVVVLPGEREHPSRREPLQGATVR